MRGYDGALRPKSFEVTHPMLPNLKYVVYKRTAFIIKHPAIVNCLEYARIFPHYTSS